MPYTPHKLLKTPIDTQRIWRFVDLGKFLSMVTKSSLHFTRVDLLTRDDPFEGLHSNPELYTKEFAKERLGKFMDVAFRMSSVNALANKSKSFVSSWHANDQESAAMWKLYSVNDYGLAISTTFQKLIVALEAFQEPIYIGSITYLDYSSETVPYGNALYPLFHKRKSFEHERELRGVIINEINSNKEGVTVKVNLNELIDVIYVSPTAPSWIQEVVEDICMKYGLVVDIKQSDLLKMNY